VAWVVSNDPTTAIGLLTTLEVEQNVSDFDVQWGGVSLAN
jgi:hypothetical protein